MIGREEKKSLRKRLFSLAIPMMIANIFSNLIGLINNVTVGTLGTEQLAGVAIANQLITVYHTGLYGAVSGAEIFGTQFQGKKDHDSTRSIFRIKIILMAALTIIAFLVFLPFGRTLINAFLHAENENYDIALALNEGTTYLHMMLIGFIPNSLNFAYCSTLREGNYTKLTMMSSISGLVISFVLSMILIPMFGVTGAALATIISRFLEISIVVIWTRTHLEEMPYFKNAFSSFKIPSSLLKQVIKTGMPLTLNETIWAIGCTMLTQCFSYRGVSAVAAVNIASTISTVVNVAVYSTGMSSGIILGQLLGNGEKEKAYNSSFVLLKYASLIGLIVGLTLFVLGPLIPLLYTNTDANIQHIAKWLIWGDAVNALINAPYNNSYYTLRSGGKTMLTFLFDSGSIWAINVLSALLIAHFTNMNIIYFYWLERLLDIIKCVAGFFIVRQGSWAQNLTEVEYL